jgi:hypothetical protein
MQIAADQGPNLEGLSGAGAIRRVPAPDDARFACELALALGELDADATTRGAMGQAGRRLVDGRGTERVAAAVTAMCAAGASR